MFFLQKIRKYSLLFLSINLKKYEILSFFFFNITFVFYIYIVIHFDNMIYIYIQLDAHLIYILLTSHSFY